MSFARAAALALAVLLLMPLVSAPVRAAVATLPPSLDCNFRSGDDAKAEADRIMARHLQIGNHPDWMLPTDPTWREQPFRAVLATYLHGRGHDRPPQIRLTARIVASHPSGTRTLG